MGKLCKGCGEVKPRDQFHRRRASPDGLFHRCKSCKQAYDATEGRRDHRRKYNRNRYRRDRVKCYARAMINQAVARGGCFKAEHLPNMRRGSAN